MKILYLGRKINSEPTNGGDCGGLRNKRMLIDLYGEKDIDFIEIPRVSALKRSTFNEYSYKVFMDKYSDKAVYETFNQYISETY